VQGLARPSRSAPGTETSRRSRPGSNRTLELRHSDGAADAIRSDGAAQELKRFGWPTLIITAVVALGFGGFIGGAGDSTTAEPPASTVTVTESAAAGEPDEPAPTKR
jgi:hypothetical protein